MPPKLYELRVFKGTQRVRTAHQLRCAVDEADPAAMDDLLTRHLLAAAERDGAHRRDAHLYHLDVYEVRDGNADNRMKFQFSVPVAA